MAVWSWCALSEAHLPVISKWMTVFKNYLVLNDIKCKKIQLCSDSFHLPKNFKNRWNNDISLAFEYNVIYISCANKLEPTCAVLKKQHFSQNLFSKILCKIVLFCWWFIVTNKGNYGFYFAPRVNIRQTNTQVAFIIWNIYGNSLKIFIKKLHHFTIEFFLHKTFHWDEKCNHKIFLTKCFCIICRCLM